VPHNPAHHCLDATPSFFPPDDLLRLNHYTSKSQQEFDIKAKRGYADNNPHENRHGDVPRDYSKEVDLSILASFIMVGGCKDKLNSSLCSDSWIFNHDAYPESTRNQIEQHCRTLPTSKSSETSVRIFKSAYVQACTYLMRAGKTPAVTNNLRGQDTLSTTLPSKGSRLKIIGVGLGTTVSHGATSARTQTHKSVAFL